MRIASTIVQYKQQRMINGLLFAWQNYTSEPKTFEALLLSRSCEGQFSMWTSYYSALNQNLVLP